jgi:hypothetical protein
VHFYDGGQPYDTRQQAWLQAYLSAGQTWDGTGVIVNGYGKANPKVMVILDRMVGTLLLSSVLWQLQQQ